MIILTGNEQFWMISWKKLPARKYFYSSTKDGRIGDDGKISNGHISVKDYLICEKTWDKFEMEYMSDYHNHYLKKRCIVISWCFWRVYWHMFETLWIRSLSLF